MTPSPVGRASHLNQCNQDNPPQTCPQRQVNLNSPSLALSSQVIPCGVNLTIKTTQHMAYIKLSRLDDCNLNCLKKKDNKTRDYIQKETLPIEENDCQYHLEEILRKCNLVQRWQTAANRSNTSYPHSVKTYMNTVFLCVGNSRAL